ncbi:TolC family protein [Aphanothece sacrum]|uniref:Transporter n=1 Tax=Aphanothece sacrum FPU1 TaxID=1920663 RepID=A0A401IDZ5_APHSA|nr:TolC family protein [Aphanothece sacrum]GBF79497.1 transporter [Aphanothece sacrum FPU1]GBF83962.1 transporter [Aphanothece sacrum FPU3]
MFALRYCVSVSVGILIVLANGVSITAQTVSNPEATQTTEEPQPSSGASLLSLENEPSVTGVKTEPNVTSQNQVLEPSSPNSVNVGDQGLSSETTLEKLPPNNLNPSGNPLLFPTKPDEVKPKVRQPITLEQAISLALQNNKELQEARLLLEELKAELGVARADLFPSLDIEASLDRIRNDRVFGGGTDVLGTLLPETTTAETFTNVQSRASLTYTIYSGGERAARIARAEREVRRQDLGVEISTERIRFEATDNYYRLQNDDAQVAIAQAAVEDTTQSLRDAQLLEQAGLGTRFDVLRAEGDLATANEGLTRAIAAQRTSRRRLAETLSVGQHVELTAADEIAESGTWKLTLDQTIVRAYKNRAELEQELIQGEIAEQDREIALAQIRPQVDFTAFYFARENFDDAVPVLTDWTFETRVRWRLFDGGRAFEGARRAERRQDQANVRFANQRNEIRFQVEEAYNNLIANKENIASTRKNVERFEEALRLARLRFQAGVGTQTDVINAQRDLTDARGRFLQAIIGYNQSLNSLQRAVSNLPDGRLFQKP